MVGIALVLLLLAYKVYHGKPEEEVEQLTFEDDIKKGKVRDVLDEESAREGFFKKLDAAKVVQFDASGMILAESMAMLRQMIAVHSMTVFKDRKEELMLERLDCLRSEDWPNYQAKIG